MSESNYWSRRQFAKATRRRFLAGGVAGATGLAALGLTGCGGGDDDDDDGGVDGSTTPAITPATDTVKTGGTLRAIMGGSPRSLDPHFDTFPYNNMITNNTNDQLLRFSPDFKEVLPHLATGMPEQPDPLTFTLKIRQGVKFQNVAPANGRALTAEDVKYSIERQMTDEAGKFQHAYFFLGAVDKIETPDASTVSIKMKKKYAPMISYLASPWTLVILRELVERDGDLTKNAVGTGPFIFKEWQKDVKFELVKNPDYWKKDAKGRAMPYIDAMSWLITTEADTAATQYIDDQVDFVIVGQPQLQRTKDARSKDSTYSAVPTQFWRQFRMTPTTKEAPYPAPFNDPKVREAVVRSIDKQQVLDLVFSGDGVVAKGPILPIYPNWDLKEELAGVDVKKAQDLLKAAGNPKINGTMIWATSATQDQIGEVVKQQLTKNGINVELSPMELAAYYNQTYSYKYDFSVHTPLNSPEPDENLSSYFGRNARYFKHYNEEIWNLVDQQAEELDMTKRQQIVRDVQKKIVLDFPMSFMFTINNHNFLNKKVKNWFFHTDLYAWHMEGLWIDA